MKRLVALVAVAVALAAAGPHPERVARAVEDRFDVPGIHDCWGFLRHTDECR